MSSKLGCVALTLVVGSCVGGVAHADAPTFTYSKYEEKKVVEYQATASAGLLLTTGNANQVSFSVAAMALRNDGKNKLQLNIDAAYARASILTANDINGNGVLDNGELGHSSTTSTQLWSAKLRYDRFLSENNSIYLAGFAYGNEPAGKRVVAGGQIGYSRQLYKDDVHLLVAELGYDYSYERFVSQSANYNLHSLRAFAGYTLSPTKDTVVGVSVEYLGNMNPYAGPRGHVGAFGDSRVNGRAQLTTRLYKKLAFRLSFTARYDNVPAPLPTIGGIPFAADYKPAAQKLDTITEASLVMTFL
ncbi:MAG: DUF481 domain-containing protein [Polyangia bacterium]